MRMIGSGIAVCAKVEICALGAVEARLLNCAPTLPQNKRGNQNISSCHTQDSCAAHAIPQTHPAGSAAER